LNRARVTENGLTKRLRGSRRRLHARTRETARPHRSALTESWRPRELGERFHSSPGVGARGTTEGRVLIVDDESAIRLVCRLNLHSAGFDTLEASDGASALALARAERPDLILLDIMLPEVDGWSVAEELAQADDTREIPVIFLSARSEDSDQARAHETGGVGYITKPFDPSAMTETVRTVVERARRGEREAMRREWQQSFGAG
jgi:CheY-like chemotaxis protein